MLDKIDAVPLLKLNMLILNEETNVKISECIQYQTAVKNVCTKYTLAKIYKSTSIAEINLRYIERCFTMVVESKNFLELNDILLTKILANSELLTTSEIEILNAVDKWVNHNFVERSKFAKNLLLKVRFHLLSEHVLKDLLKKSSSIFGIKECNAIIKDVLNKKTESLFQNKSSIYYSSRYCNQNMFNTLICGGYDIIIDEPVSAVKQIEGKKI